MKHPTRIEMEDFKTVLNNEILLYNDMERYLDQKKQVIIQGDLDTLVKIDNELDRLNQRARELEQERLTIMVHMGREGETLKEFIASLESGEDTLILEHAREQLAHTMEGIQELSRTNRDLLTQSIRFIEQSVDFIASILAPGGASYTNMRTGRQGVLEAPPENTFEVPSTICHEA